jgi:hypothetical protein
MPKKTIQPKKKVIPRYWWDFVWTDGKITHLIVESDDDEKRIMAKYGLDPNGDAEEIIKIAEKLMWDLKCGRISHSKHKPLDVPFVPKKAVWKKRES